MEDNTINLKLVEDLAKAIGISPKLAPGVSGHVPSILIKKILAQLKKVPYIQWPVSFHTIDIIPFRLNQQEEYEILCGRKKGKTKFQTIGGFLEPAESAEQAAPRELEEESSLEGVKPQLDPSFFAENHLFYHGSFFIDDERYKDSPHKISSSLYSTFLNYADTVNSDGMEFAKGKDDIEEVKWFEAKHLLVNHEELIEGLHWPLLEQFYFILNDYI